MRSVVLVLAITACGGGARPAPPTHVPVPAPEPPPPPPAIVVRSEAELAALGHSTKESIDYTRFALVVIAGLTEPAIVVEIGTVDRMSGATPDPDDWFADTIALRIDAGEIVVDAFDVVSTPCPPAVIDTNRVIPLLPVGAFPPTLAFVIPVEDATLPVRFAYHAVDRSFPCPLLRAG